MRNTVLLALLMALATLSRADDAYNNFGAGNLSNSGSSYLLGANSAYQFSSEGFQFVATATGTLTGLNAAINGGALPITFSLYTDNAGLLGSSLGSWSATASPTSGTASANAVASATASGVSLTAGTTYWFVATNTDTAVSNALHWNSAVTVPTTSKRYTLRSGTALYYTNSLGAFSVQVTPVPEPASLAALGLGVSAVLRRRRR